jgi:RND family efflux transporter MFP subunit
MTMPNRSPSSTTRAVLAAGVLLALAGQALAQATPPSAAPTSPVLADKANAAAVSASTPFVTLADAFGGYKSDTRPSRDAIMQFSLSTEIREILAPAGKRVRKGEILMRARDAEVRAAIDRQKILAESTLEVQNTEKQLELAQFRFERLKAGGMFSQSEFEELRINVDAGKLQVEQAKTNLQAQKVALVQLDAQAERYYLEAPFDGVIEDVMVEVGQGVTEQEKILRIVNTEKLWLDAYASTTETIRLNLREGASAWALIDLADNPRLVKGTVLYVSPVADSVSQTRRVRIEVDNPENWPAGTPARVRFTDPGKEWDSYSQSRNGRSVSVSDSPSESVSPRLDVLQFLASTPTKVIEDKSDLFVRDLLDSTCRYVFGSGAWWRPESSQLDEGIFFKRPHDTETQKNCCSNALVALEMSAASTYQVWLDKQITPWHSHNTFRYVSAHTLFPGAQLND